MNGKFANTAFCLFDPQGKRQLTRTGRSPDQVIGRRGGGENEGIIREMNVVAARYRPRGKDGDAVLQDFLSFGQALNVASADQRLLVFVNADEVAAKKLSPTLKKLFADEEIVGRFHLDFRGEDDAKWGEAINGSKSNPAINVIQAGKYGVDGSVVNQLPLDSSLEKLKAKLLAENKKFAASEKRKIYSEHVMEGKRSGVKYESEIPYGEDRDGDGEIDKPTRGGGGRAGGGNRPGGGMGQGRFGRRRQAQ